MPKTSGKGAPARRSAPASRTFEAFTPKAKRSPTRAEIQAKRASTRSSRLTITILGGIAAGLVAALVFGALTPKDPWPFDRPAAKLPSLQTRHTLY